MIEGVGGFFRVSVFLVVFCGVGRVWFTCFELGGWRDILSIRFRVWYFMSFV